MRTLSSRIFIVIVSTLAITTPVLAQPARVAYIDAEKILKLMPEAKDAQTRLDQLTQAWTAEAKDMQAEIDRKQADYDRRKLIMTDAERSATELDLQNLRKRHDDFLQQKFGPDGGELFQQQAELMKPAYEKLDAAIKEAAADGNYDYVIDRSSKDVVLLYANSKYDITIPVARKLGIQSQILSTPLVANKPLVPSNNSMETRPPNNNTPNTNFPQVPMPGNGVNPPSQPGFNQGGYNPNQIPPPVQKPTTPR